MDIFQIGGGYSYTPLRVGLIVRAPNGREIYVQPGDAERIMRENIASLDEVSENINDEGRGLIADIVLGEYF